MTEPRAVTAPNGLTRWGAADGSTYSSKWEAEDANLRLEGMLPEPEVIETKEPSAVQRLIGLLVLGGATAFFGWMAIAGPIYAYEGKLDFKHEWMWLAAPFVWFVMAGMAPSTKTITSYLDLRSPVSISFG